MTTSSIKPMVKKEADATAEEEENGDDCDILDWETTLSGRRVNTQWRKRLKMKNVSGIGTQLVYNIFSFVIFLKIWCSCSPHGNVVVCMF